MLWKLRTPFLSLSLISRSPFLFVWIDGWPASVFPLPLCGGDCDSDSDCQGNLICFQRRSRFTAVPGCRGGENDSSQTDYCVSPGGGTQPEPTTLRPALRPSPNPTTPPFISTNRPTSAAPTPTRRPTLRPTTQPPTLPPVPIVQSMIQYVGNGKSSLS